MNVASAITLLASLLLCSSRGPLGISAHEVEHLYKVEYLRTADAVRALEALFPSINLQVAEDGIVATASCRQQIELKDALDAIDSPSITVETRNVVLHKRSASDVAKYLNLLFGTKDFFAVADTRTSRVFLLSSPQKMDVAESLIGLMDRY